MGTPAREGAMEQGEVQPELAESSVQGEASRQQQSLYELPSVREKSMDAQSFREKFKEILLMEDNVEKMENFMATYDHPRFVWLDLLLSSPSKNIEDKSGTCEVDPIILSSFTWLTWENLIMCFPDVIERELFLDVLEYVDAETKPGDRFGPLHGAVLCGRPDIVHLLRDHSGNTVPVKKGICRRLEKYLKDDSKSWNFGDCFGTIKRALLWCFLPNPVAYKRVARFLSDFEKAKDPDNGQPNLEYLKTSSDDVPDEIRQFLWTVILAWSSALGQSHNLRRIIAVCGLGQDWVVQRQKAVSEYVDRSKTTDVPYEKILQDDQRKRAAVEKLVQIVSQIMKKVNDQKIPHNHSPSDFLQVCSMYNLSCRVPASCLASCLDSETLKENSGSRIQGCNSRWTAIHLAAALGDLKVFDALVTSYDSALKRFPEELEIELEAKSGTKTMESLLRDTFVDKFGMTPLHHGVLGNHPPIVQGLLQWKFFTSHLNDADVFDRTAFQMVCSNCESDTVAIIELFMESKSHIKMNTAENCCRFTPLHWATFAGATEAVRCLLQDPKSRGIRTMAKNSDEQHPHKLAEVHPLSVKKEIQDLLESVPEVKDSVDRLYRDRQVYVDGANAILIGASVIASVTFGGWLQVPLGDGDESTYTKVHIFWAFNSLSFFLAMGTVIAGTLSVLPQADKYIEDSVENLRKWLKFTASMFVGSIICVLGAFAAAGFSSSSLVNDLYASMAATTGFGSFVCGLLAIIFGLRLLGIRGIQPKEDREHNVFMRWANSISKRLPRLGCSAPSKESNKGDDDKSLEVVLRLLTKVLAQKGSKVGDDTYETQRREFSKQLHRNPRQQSCHFRSCYRILESESKVQKREWYGKTLLPQNKAMWREIILRLDDIRKQAADHGQPSKHFLFKDGSEGFTSKSEAINHLKRYGVITFQKENVSVKKYVENLNRKAREDFRKDVEELSVNKADPSPGIKQINKSMWEVYSPPDRPPDLEIIFFHGLQPDSDHENAFWKNWVTTSDDRLVWPQVWLPTQFPTARILFASHFWSRFLQEIGENLVADIVNSRCGQNVPVFLVGHSLGGVLMKQVLISFKWRSAMSSHLIPKSFDNFLDNVKGVYFYGTPQSDKNRLAQLVSQMPHVPSLAELVQISDFARLNEKFRALRRFYNVRMGAEGEGLPTKYRGFNGMVVPQEASALLDMDQYWTNLRADHFTVCRARSATDSMVIRITDFIRKSLETT